MQGTGVSILLTQSPGNKTNQKTGGELVVTQLSLSTVCRGTVTVEQGHSYFVHGKLLCRGEAEN
jgi:hypothetical protein